MFKKPLGLLGIFLIVVGIGYFVGAGVAYSKVQGGYDSLQSFSAAQDVQLTYNEQGELVDRGTVEGAQAIRSLLEDDWNFPVVESDLDPNDPLVNSASEYMYQMATIAYHTLHGTQNVVLTANDLTGDDGTLATTYLCNDETLNVPDPFPAEGVTCEFNVDGRYWTGFDRSDPVQAKARDMAWSGTAHALVAELGVGAATHSTLQLALGVAALLAGLGVVCTVMGIAFLWETRRRGRLQVPETIPDAVLLDTPLATTSAN
ncbi:MAG TPA: hypothetical protein VFX15_12450 [Actinomycetes bacterium]|jgi:hypothetical protein|nr:hypothetical protein [Actinomycetes bacterium]